MSGSLVRPTLALTFRNQITPWQYLHKILTLLNLTMSMITMRRGSIIGSRILTGSQNLTAYHRSSLLYVESTPANRPNPCSMIHTSDKIMVDLSKILDSLVLRRHLCVAAVQYCGNVTIESNTLHQSQCTLWSKPFTNHSPQ